MTWSISSAVISGVTWPLAFVVDGQREGRGAHVVLPGRLDTGHRNAFLDKEP
jgi:hypothetical protein